MAFPSTFLDLQAAVITKARLDTTADTAKVKDWINQVYYQVVVETEASVTSTTISMVNGTSRYTLAATIARLKTLYVTPVGQTRPQPPMKRTTLEDIISRRQDSGATAVGGVWPTHYTLQGINTLEVWPTPAGVDVITAYYAAFPTALSANGDVPILEEPYASKLLEYGALGQAGDWKGDPATAEWQGQFSDWFARYLQHLELKKGDIPGQFHQWGTLADTSDMYSGWGGWRG